MNSIKTISKVCSNQNYLKTLSEGVSTFFLDSEDDKVSIAFSLTNLRTTEPTNFVFFKNEQDINKYDYDNVFSVSNEEVRGKTLTELQDILSSKLEVIPF